MLSNVGVENFGPLKVKFGQREEKRCCCLFRCLPVRLTVLEIVPKLDTDSCLNAIMHFIARRGKPVEIISDIWSKFVGAEIFGSKFVGAEINLSEYISVWNKERIEEHLTQQRIIWKFNPHAERLVKSCKNAIYAGFGNRSVTEDVLSTTMCLVEQALNA